MTAPQTPIDEGPDAYLADPYLLSPSQHDELFGRWMGVPWGNLTVAKALQRRGLMTDPPLALTDAGHRVVQELIDAYELAAQEDDPCA